ncbi:winged helix-turn-helix transcriptional regulator [bacterium]|nr:winged helix-turn-helix transcriptional regulator [bacterium]
MPSDLDAIDIRILDLIQHDAGFSVAEIADKVGLSSSPCWRRIKRLEEQGVIFKRVTLLSHEKLGLNFAVIANVKLQLPTRDNLERFESAVRKWPEVVECMTVTGAVDYVMRIVTTDMHAYDDFLRDKLLALGLVSDIQSRIIVNVAKRTTAAPLSLVSPHASTSER